VTASLDTVALDLPIGNEAMNKVGVTNWTMTVMGALTKTMWTSCIWRTVRHLVRAFLASENVVILESSNAGPMEMGLNAPHNR